MVLINATSVITPVVAGGAIDNYTFIFILAGGFLGTYLGLVVPFYREKNKYGKEGIELLFDKDFLKIAGGSLVIAIVGTGAIYPHLTALADPSVGYIASFMSAITWAFSMNIAGNWIKGSNNKDAEEQFIVKKAQALQASGKFDTILAKLNGEKSDNNGGSSVTEPSS